MKGIDDIPKCQVTCLPLIMPIKMVINNHLLMFDIEYEAAKALFEFSNPEIIQTYLGLALVTNESTNTLNINDLLKNAYATTISPDLNRYHNLTIRYGEILKESEIEDNHIPDDFIKTAQHLNSLYPDSQTHPSPEAIIEIAEKRLIYFKGLNYDFQRTSTAKLLMKSIFILFLVAVAIHTSDVLPAIFFNYTVTTLTVCFALFGILSAWPSKPTRISQPFSWIVSKNIELEGINNLANNLNSPIISNNSLTPALMGRSDFEKKKATQSASSAIAKRILVESHLKYKHNSEFSDYFLSKFIKPNSSNPDIVIAQARSSAKLKHTRMVEPYPALLPLQWILYYPDQLFSLCFPNPTIELIDNAPSNIKGLNSDDIPKPPNCILSPTKQPTISDEATISLKA